MGKPRYLEKNRISKIRIEMRIKALIKLRYDNMEENNKYYLAGG